MEQIGASAFGGWQSEHQSVIAPPGKWIGHFYDWSRHCELLLWGSGQRGLRSKIHTVYTYLGKVACDACRGLNLPLDYCRTSQ